MNNLLKNSLFLIFIVIIVHFIFSGFIRPEANLIIETAKNTQTSVPRNFYIIVKDIEQEICFILLIWGVFLILQKCLKIINSNYLFNIDLIERQIETKKTAEEVINKLNNQLDKNLKETPLIESINLALLRYSQTKNVQNVSDSIKSSIEMLSTKQDSDNAMIRYLIWAIPSVGFIGTVRGIGLALSNADKAIAGNISLMTENLGIAFNSTFVALIISLILMLFFHQLQKLQDENLVDIQEYCEKYLYSKFT